MTSANGQQNPRTMRLPGSVAEIEGSPSGPEIGAFFDLDGTLVAGFTGVVMTQDRLRRRQMSVAEFIGMVQAGSTISSAAPSSRTSSVRAPACCAATP
jgi:hypothetical protein